jgi:hypothetical protein
VSFATTSLGLWAVPPENGTSGRILKPGISENVCEIEKLQDRFAKGTDIAGKKALKIRTRKIRRRKWGHHEFY